MSKSFPLFPVQASIFYINSLMDTGGFTLGGVRSFSPDPSGIGVLKITPSLIKTERGNPLGSWLLSNVSGEIFNVKILGNSPQVIGGSQDNLWDNGQTWDSGQPWDTEDITTVSSESLVSSSTITISDPNIVQLFQRGHIVGHRYNTYLIDDVTPNADGSVELRVKPPLRRHVSINDTIYLKPWFTGSIDNGSNLRSGYTASLGDNMRIPEIIIREVF